MVICIWIKPLIGSSEANFSPVGKSDRKFAWTLLLHYAMPPSHFGPIGLPMGPKMGPEALNLEFLGPRRPLVGLKTSITGTAWSKTSNLTPHTAI